MPSGHDQSPVLAAGPAAAIGAPPPGAGAADGRNSLPGTAGWRPNPAVIAWAGLVAVLALLAIYSLFAPQPRAVVLTDSPFVAPVLLHRLGPAD